MPIANCVVVSPPAGAGADAIVRAWSARSGIDADPMTVNILPSHRGGKRYAAMAWLYPPSMSSDDDVVALEKGLAAALAEVLHLPPSTVQVLTSIVTPGSVVEAGETLRW